MLTKVAPVLHLDWIQMQIKWQKKTEPVFHRMYEVKTLDFGTRHFKVVQEIYLLKKRIATLTSKPHSNILDPDAMIVKFDNWVCYAVNMRKLVVDFIECNNFEFISFSRVDFCADFNVFDNGMLPPNFIRKYIYRKCLRLGKSPNVAHHFSQGKKEHITKGLKFGSNLSEVTAYVYNKSLEMEVVKWKPWIFHSWQLGGLDVKQDVWRLEFSMKSGGTLIVNKDDGTLDLFLTLDLLDFKFMHDSYFVLYQKYFQFVWNDGQVRRDRMRKIQLFNFVPWNEILVHASEMKDANRSKKIFIKKLHELNNELRGRDFFMSIYGDQLKDTIISDASLQSWAMKKGM